MAEVKTKPNLQSVTDFLDKVKNEQKRRDCYTILKLMKKITKAEPRMWGGSIVGFGCYHYTYASGREVDRFVVGFSPRKQNLTLYIMSGFSRFGELMSKLGNYKTGKCCLYINKLDDVDQNILKELVTLSIEMISNKKW